MIHIFVFEYFGSKKIVYLKQVEIIIFRRPYVQNFLSWKANCIFAINIRHLEKSCDKNKHTNIKLTFNVFCMKSNCRQNSLATNSIQKVECDPSYRKRLYLINKQIRSSFIGDNEWKLAETKSLNRIRQ